MTSLCVSRFVGVYDLSMRGALRPSNNNDNDVSDDDNSTTTTSRRAAAVQSISVAVTDAGPDRKHRGHIYDRPRGKRVRK